MNTSGSPVALLGLIPLRTSIPISIHCCRVFRFGPKRVSLLATEPWLLSKKSACRRVHSIVHTAMHRDNSTAPLKLLFYIYTSPFTGSVILGGQTFSIQKSTLRAQRCENSATGIHPLAACSRPTCDHFPRTHFRALHRSADCAKAQNTSKFRSCAFFFVALTYLRRSSAANGDAWQTMDTV